jgi:predicted anti-sigma-YlaC factor YlaD
MALSSRPHHLADAIIDAAQLRSCHDHRGWFEWFSAQNSSARLERILLS